MCGIAGFLAGRDLPKEEAAAIAAAMGQSLRHRGPDAGSEWFGAGGRLALAHRRLSILELSAAGSQPMRSHCGRLTIVFNGEIYNFQQLRTMVAASRGPVAWRGHSDTEALLEAIVEFGAEGAVAASKGMFAFAVWDEHKEELTLARDRFGKKPLYYGMLGRDFAFSSEIVALRRHPDWQFVPDRKVLADFLRCGYVPDPGSAFKGIQKLPAGCLLTLGPGDVQEQTIPRPRVWWRAECLTRSRSCSDPAALEGILTEAVSTRLVADVPLGAFLSGGIDSTLVTALMKRLTGSVQTFTIGFEDSPTDEAAHASRVAQHLGTVHRQFTLTQEDAIEIMPRVMACFDEPFADASAVPTWLVAQLAARDVKVVLTGDGADEIFGGYTRYHADLRLWRMRSWLPMPVRWAVARVLMENEPRADQGRWSSLAWSLAAPDLANFYRRRTSFFHFPEALLPGVDTPDQDDFQPVHELSSPRRSMMAIDLLGYLPGDILTKVDRTTMSHGLEARSPFLDDRVAAFAWGLPDSALFSTGSGKRILKEYLFRLVPRELVERPKTGFGFPVETWLRGRMRPWVESTLFGSRWSEEVDCDLRAVRRVWQGLLSGNLRLGGGIWNLLVLAMWVERQLNGVADGN